MAERVGLLKTIPGFHPAGALHATKFVPDKFVEPTDRLRGQRFSRPPHSTTLAPLHSSLAALRGGEGGIRTHEGLLTLAGFQDQCIQPLCHLS